MVSDKTDKDQPAENKPQTSFEKEQPNEPIYCD